MRKIEMKKRYTKKQIMESIKYWQKQLKAGNYKKLNEDSDIERPGYLYDVINSLNNSKLKWKNVPGRRFPRFDINDEYYLELIADNTAVALRSPSKGTINISSRTDYFWTVEDAIEYFIKSGDLKNVQLNN